VQSSPRMAQRFDLLPVRQRPAGPRPMGAVPDQGLAATRGVGNEYLQRTADCGSGPDRIDEGGCPGGCGGCALARAVQPKPIVGPADGPDEREADGVAERVTGDSPLGIRRAPTAGRTTGTAAPPLPSHIGQPLSDATLAFMQPRFGQDFGEVRLHAGPAIDRYATVIQARAFTYGHDIHLRSGESEQDHRLMAHELTHVVQQRGGTAATATATLQRAISPELDEIDDLLSYGLLDWAITDAEAERALAILKTLPRFQQAAFFADVKHSSRLRSNLPDARVPEFDALAADVASMEPSAAALAAIDDRLSYGLLDWAITDRDAAEALEMLKKLSGPPLATALATINYQRLLDNLPDSRKRELLDLHDIALGHGGTRETEEAEHPGTRVAGIAFRSDHGVMKDNTEDWTNSGTPYAEPEWRLTSGGPVSHPISQTRDTSVTVEVGLDVLPENAPPSPVRLSGRSSEPALSFAFAGTLEGGRDRRVTTTSTGKLPDTVRALRDKQIAWTLQWRDWTHEIGRTQHTVFVTAAPPLSPAEVTEKRMSKAVEIAGDAANRIGGIHPHPLVREIMKHWGTYNLHIAYHNAWELADNIETGAQCIDIVRFVQGVTDTVGVPGTATAVVVWAKPATPLVPEESTWPHGGLHTVPNHPANPTWFPGLIDANECPNAFEAALRFDHGGVRRYYPGGVSMNSIYTTPEDVLYIFQCYAWLTSLGGREFNIESIAATYPRGSCSPGRIRCG
jgi:Domain of unknown function (DUF4157)